MQNINYKQTDIYYRVFGNGSPIVFLHGFLEDSNIWLDFIQPLKESHQIILIDLPCHGKSRFNGEI